MTHRPYPNADRALHQVDRHYDETPPYAEPRPMTQFERQLAEGARVALERVAPIAARVLAGFQPRPVGGEETTT